MLYLFTPIRVIKMVIMLRHNAHFAALTGKKYFAYFLNLFNRYS